MPGDLSELVKVVIHPCSRIEFEVERKVQLNQLKPARYIRGVMKELEGDKVVQVQRPESLVRAVVNESMQMKPDNGKVI